MNIVKDIKILADKYIFITYFKVCSTILYRV
jgi:hypothetical protein